MYFTLKARQLNNILYCSNPSCSAKVITQTSVFWCNEFGLSVFLFFVLKHLFTHLEFDTFHVSFETSEKFQSQINRT